MASVNCVFNPDYIDTMFPRSAKHRHNLLAEARATNYGVVRLELIEELYERMYDHRRELGPDETTWPHRIMGGRQIKSIEPRSNGRIDLRIQSLEGITAEGMAGEEELFEADVVIAATGYERSAHVDILHGAREMLPKAASSSLEYRKGIAGWNVGTENGERKLAVGRDYQVQFTPGAVAEGSGVWLQGCCEGTHGVSLTDVRIPGYKRYHTDELFKLSDTLLSVLATRSGEIVQSIFGEK